MIKKSFFIRIIGIIVCGAYSFLGHSWSVFLYNVSRQNCHVVVNLLWCKNSEQEVESGSWIEIDRGICALTSIYACASSVTPAFFTIPLSPISDSCYLLIEENSLLVIREVDSQKFMQITYQKNAFNREACQAALREMAKLLFEAALLEEEARREQDSTLKKRAHLLAKEAVVEKELRESRKKVAGQRERLQKATKLRQEAGKMQNGTLLEQLQKVNIFLEAIKAEDKAREDLAEGLTKPIVSGKVDW